MSISDYGQFMTRPAMSHISIASPAFSGFEIVELEFCFSAFEVATMKMTYLSLQSSIKTSQCPYFAIVFSDEWRKSLKQYDLPEAARSLFSGSSFPMQMVRNEKTKNKKHFSYKQKLLAAECYDMTLWYLLHDKMSICKPVLSRSCHPFSALMLLFGC